MDVMLILAGLTTLGLIVYLFVALLAPERLL